MDDLDKYIDENTTFIAIANGEEFEGDYTGRYEVVPNAMDPTKKTVLYYFKVGESEKPFKTASTKVAKILRNTDAGTRLKVRRAGEGLQTKYEITRV